MSSVGRGGPGAAGGSNKTAKGWRQNIGGHNDAHNFRESIWNGFGTTKTKPSLTLFVANIPKGCWFRRVEALFTSDPGITQVRQAKRMSMVFVDYQDQKSATSAMLRHQNHQFPGVERTGGLKIDYDKDPDQKRNRAHEKDMKAQPSAAMLGPRCHKLCRLCRDTTHAPSSDPATCPYSPAYCPRCKQTGHPEEMCCAATSDVHQQPQAEQAPVPEALPDGFAQGLLAKYSNPFGATSELPPAKRAKTNALGIQVVKVSRVKSTSKPVEEKGKMDSLGASASTVGDEGAERTGSTQDNEESDGREKVEEGEGHDQDQEGDGGLLGLGDYGSDDESE